MRSFGAEHGRQIGAGFMFKNTSGDEFRNFTFPYYSVCYVIRGTGRYVDASGKSYSLRPGSVFQRFPDRPHSSSIDSNQDWVECFIDFDLSSYRFLESIGIVNPDSAAVIECSTHAMDAGVFELLQQLKNATEAQLPDLFLRASSLLRDMLTRPQHLVQEHVEFIHQACIDLTRDFTHKIDVQEYCRNHARGYEWFRKAFKQTVGVSPGRYVVRRRIDVACQYLRDSHHTVSQIATMLGYNSASDFSAQFKSVLGVAPQNYRQVTSQD